MPWLAGVLGAVLSRLFAIFFGWLALKLSQRVALALLIISVAGSLFLVCAFAVKALIMSIRVSMPNSIAPFTYFLPSSINYIVGTAVTIRVSYFIYTWSLRNLFIFARAQD